MAKKVLIGLVTAWRLAGRPMRRSPSSVKATIDGVVFIPSALTITFGWPPSMTATHELVVPKSIPITFDIWYPHYSCTADRPGPTKHKAPDAPRPRQEPRKLRSPGARVVLRAI